jgi:hypothetical protein
MAETAQIETEPAEAEVTEIEVTEEPRIQSESFSAPVEKLKKELTSLPKK